MVLTHILLLDQTKSMATNLRTLHPDPRPAQIPSQMGRLSLASRTLPKPHPSQTIASLSLTTTELQNHITEQLILKASSYYRSQTLFVIRHSPTTTAKLSQMHEAFLLAVEPTKLSFTLSAPPLKTSPLPPSPNNHWSCSWKRAHLGLNLNKPWRTWWQLSRGCTTICVSLRNINGEFATPPTHQSETWEERRELIPFGDIRFAKFIIYVYIRWTHIWRWHNQWNS